MKAIRKNAIVLVNYKGEQMKLRVQKKIGNYFETYAPITYMDGSVHLEKMQLSVNSVIEVL